MVEIWKPVDGFIEKYEVSNLGNVRRRARIGHRGRKIEAKLLKLLVDRCGYPIVQMSDKPRYKNALVHRLVLSAFSPSATVRQVNHIDGDKRNNRLENLEWVTSMQNIRHAVRTGLSRRKLSYEQAQEIRDRAAAGVLTRREIAHFYKIHVTHVGEIVREEIFKPEVYEAA